MIGGRFSVTFTPNDRLALRALANRQDSEQAMKQAIDYNDQSGAWVVSRFMQEPQTDEFSIFSLEGSYDLASSHRICGAIQMNTPV